MAERTAADEAARQRIIKHMNEDHHDSIVRYLEHYRHLPSWTAYDSAMTNIGLNGMLFTCSGKSYRIQFNPPMKSFKEARERVVEMDKECLRALDRSDITVKEYVPPSGIYVLDFAIIAATFVGFSQRWWFAKGGAVEHALGPSFTQFCWYIQPLVLWGMLGIHVTELVYFIRNHLRKHSVNVGTSLWWKWVGTVFIEGQFAYMRFNELVRKKREEKEKQKH